jgi:hypothetical protein
MRIGSEAGPLSQWPLSFQVNILHWRLLAMVRGMMMCAGAR